MRIKLKQIISDTAIPKKQKITEGLVTNFIAGILKILYTGKAKILYSQINNNPKLVDATQKLQISIDDYKKMLNDPKIQAYLNNLDPKVVKGIIDLSDPF